MGFPVIRGQGYDHHLSCNLSRTDSNVKYLSTMPTYSNLVFFPKGRKATFRLLMFYQKYIQCHDSALHFVIYMEASCCLCRLLIFAKQVTEQRPCNSSCDTFRMRLNTRGESMRMAYNIVCAKSLWVKCQV